jgi:DNA polymerase-3 subunit alpha
MGTIEELGLLKMDFLGLRNLTVIKAAENLVKARLPEFAGLFPEDDPETFDMLSQGRTSGVFQLESAGMTGVCTRLRPHSIAEIMAVVALFRPGPMASIPRYIDNKHHPERTTYRHPLLKPILSETYGCIVYQEHVLEILRRLAGFSLGHADVVRRAMSKKKYDVLVAERQAFMDGCKQSGVPEETAKGIFDEIMEFANYGFPKGHAVSYAVIAYKTAYYKCHYPAEYMAALLSSVQGWTGKVGEYISECQEQGIKVLPPDVNASDEGFTPINGEGAGPSIRFGLGAIKNLGSGLIGELIDERREDGPFTSFENFCRRMAKRDLNRRALESLIQCGAFDSMGVKRKAIYHLSGALMDDIVSGRTIAGQTDLFSMGGDTREVPIPDVGEWSVKEKLAMERSLTGLYLSGHPIDAYASELRRSGARSIAQVAAGLEDGTVEDGQSVKLAGLLSGVKTKTTRNNTLMAYATLEDRAGSIELLLFSGVLTRNGGYVKNDAAVLIEGKVSVRDDRPAQVLVDALTPLGQGLHELDGDTEREEKNKLFLKIPQAGGREDRRILAMLELFAGRTPTVLVYADTGKKVGCECGPAPSFLAECRALLGDASVVLRG